MVPTRLTADERRTVQRLEALPRWRQIQVLRQQGLTLEQLGQKFGVSRQRMHQILAKLDIAQGKE